MLRVGVTTPALVRRRTSYVFVPSSDTRSATGTPQRTVPNLVELVTVPAFGYSLARMKSFGAFLFFAFFTALVGTGIVVAATKGSLWLLLFGFLAYMALLTKFGCQVD